MVTRLNNLDRDTPMPLPPNLCDWISANHIVHFLIDAIDRLSAEYLQCQLAPDRASVRSHRV